MASAALAATAAATTKDAGKAAAARTRLAENLDTFLNMLTTQLKNQDPLSPMDSTEFTNQLVQFANVEQQINANSSLEKLISLNRTNQMSSAVNYLGTDVVIESDKLALQGGTAKFSYTLPDASDDTTIFIKDSSGKTVRTIKGDKLAGEHGVSWDGKDDKGTKLADGPYRIVVEAMKDKTPMDDVKIATAGTVTGVTANAGDITLSMSGVDVPFDAIRAIQAPSIPAAAQ